MLDLKSLRQIAEAATKPGLGRFGRNEEFADTFDPPTILSLLDRVEKLEEALRKIEAAPAWGAPERWEATPSEVRQLARQALEQDQ